MENSFSMSSLVAQVTSTYSHRPISMFLSCSIFIVIANDFCNCGGGRTGGSGATEFLEQCSIKGSSGQLPRYTQHPQRVCSTVRETLTVLVNNSHSRSSQGKSKVNIYARKEIVYNTCLARGNPK
jgi:hypothetical protein